jgi:D-alanyl-D-alanine carboxypeptidase
MRKTTLHRAAMALLLLAVSTRADQIDDYVNSEMQRRHIQGLSLAVIKDGKVEKLGAYGQADVELSVPVTPKTIFQIQSITKTFTSTAILMLVEEGKIALDDPVSKHLDGTPDSWKNIKIRHLLSHTSGIKDFINEPTASLREEITEEEVFKATAARPLNFQPGEKYAYSNTNYHLLAMIIRKLTGKPYGQFLKERIFDPLNMIDTRIMSWSEIIPNRASGYQWRSGALHNGDFVAGSILAYGGGGILSSAQDMAKWAVALDGEKLLKKSTIEKAWSASKLNSGAMSDYGLGWGVGQTNGHRTVSHSGAHMTGFTSAIIKYRDDALSIVILTNAGGANPTRIAQHVAALYNPALMPAPAKAIEDKNPKVTQSLRQIAMGIKEGKLTAEPFTPAMWDVISPQLSSLKEQAGRDGDLKTIELLSHSESAGDQTWRYRLISTRRTHIITMVRNSEGKITGLWIEDE